MSNQDSEIALLAIHCNFQIQFGKVPTYQKRTPWKWLLQSERQEMNKMSVEHLAVTGSKQLKTTLALAR